MTEGKYDEDYKKLLNASEIILYCPRGKEWVKTIKFSLDIMRNFLIVQAVNL